MKKILLIILIVFGAAIVHGQDKNKDNISIETGINYYYHLLGHFKNNINYGFSFLLSKKINKIKISSGIEYSTKYYYYYVTPDPSIDYLNKIEHRLRYINFPFITVNFPYLINNNKEKSININILSGLILNKIINYDIISHYTNKPTLYEEDLQIASKLGLTLRLGANISKEINNHIKINVVPFNDFKLISNCINDRPDYKNVPDNTLSFGLKVGCEYLF